MKLSSLSQKLSNWHKPDINEEREELDRQTEELGLEPVSIYDAFDAGSLILLDDDTWRRLENTDSNDPSLNWELIRSWRDRDVDNIISAIKEQASLPAPIVLESANKVYCVAGNTRLSIAKLMGIVPKVWYIEESRG